MNDGWVKLHRKTLDNKIFKHDPTAWRIFEYLLLVADRHTGKRDIGRFKLASELEMVPISLYKALKRLEMAKMVTLTSNNKYTTVYICNWEKYQDNDNNQSNNKVTTEEQQSNTKQEGIYINKAAKKIVSVFPETSEILRHWSLTCLFTGEFSLADCRAAKDLMETKGSVAVKKMIVAAFKFRTTKYAPVITSLPKLQEKWDSLDIFLKRRENQPKVDEEEDLKTDLGVVRDFRGKIVKGGKF